MPKLLHPQLVTHTVVINNQQLDDIVEGLKLLAAQRPVDTKHDTEDFFYMPPEVVVVMLDDIALNETVRTKTTHGLCI